MLKRDTKAIMLRVWQATAKATKCMAGRVMPTVQRLRNGRFIQSVTPTFAAFTIVVAADILASTTAPPPTSWQAPNVSKPWELLCS